MVLINYLLSELEERTIAQRVSIPHDTSRMRYHLESNTVDNFNEFNWVIGDFYNHQFTACVSQGGALSHAEASSRAKELLEQEYRRRGGDIVTAFNDAHYGQNGGVRVLLDIITEGLKTESVRRYIRNIFDSYVTPNSWEQKVEIIRQFIDCCGSHLSNSISKKQPERYAHDYKDLINSYINALQQTSSIFRRL